MLAAAAIYIRKNKKEEAIILIGIEIVIYGIVLIYCNVVKVHLLLIVVAVQVQATNQHWQGASIVDHKFVSVYCVFVVHHFKAC